MVVVVMKIVVMMGGGDGKWSWVMVGHDYDDDLVVISR